MQPERIRIVADRSGNFEAEIDIDLIPTKLRRISGRWVISDGRVLTAAVR